MKLSRARAAALAAPMVAVVLSTGCTGDDEPAGSAAAAAPAAGEPTFSPPPYTTPGEGISLGANDQEIGDTIPEPLHVSEIPPVPADRMVTRESGAGGLEYVWDVVDPATGVVESRIATGPGIWDPVVHAFVTESSDEPAVLAAEVWRPRGNRGQADFVVSRYSGDLLDPQEIELPDTARVHSRDGSHAVTADREYFVTWDDGMYGLRVVDLEAGEQSGMLPLVGCGPFTWVVGHDVYSVCEGSRELVRITIGEDGVPVEAGRAEVLPEDFVSNREASTAGAVDAGLLVGANGDAYLFDFSQGLPERPQTPLGNVGIDSGRFADTAVNADATRIAVAYTDSAVHPHSARGGDVVQVQLRDAAGLAPVATLTLESLGMSSLDSFAFDTAGTTLYVLGEGPEVDGEAPTLLKGFDAATGTEKSSVEITGNVDDVSGLLAPEARG